MKIMMVTPVFDTGGTEVYILNLIKYLNENGEDVKLLTGPGAREKSLIEQRVDYKIVNSLKNKGIIDLFKSSIIIFQAISMYKPEIIHTSSVVTTVVSKVSVALYNILYRKKVKIVVTLHGGPNRDIEKKSAKIFNKCANIVIALSNNSKDKLIDNGLSNKKIRVVYNGIEMLKHTTDESYISNNESKVVRVLVSGRLTEQKGHRYLLDAIKVLKEKHSNLRLIILGDGELRQDLEQKVQKLEISDIVEFLGFKENVYEYINISDIFILPSLWEQFPISILEAMFLEKPIIASNVNGVGEQLGDAGILINPGNVDEIVEAIDLLISDKKKRKELGKAARRRFLDNFTLENMGRNTLGIYQELTLK